MSATEEEQAVGLAERAGIDVDTCDGLIFMDVGQLRVLLSPKLALEISAMLIEAAVHTSMPDDDRELMH